MTLEILDWHDGDLLAKPVFDKLNELVAAGVPESKILGVTTRADLNGVVKHTLEVSKVSFAPIDAAVEATGMESGGMSPIGLPADWPLLVDQHILTIPKLYLGSGIRPSKLVVDGSIFAGIPGVQFVSALGKPRG